MLSLLLGRRALVHNSVTEIELNIVPVESFGVDAHISIFSNTWARGSSAK